MGTVARQSVYTSLFAYAGVAIGYINLLYLYPAFLTPDQIGLLRTVLDAALLFAPFAQVGLAQSIIRFYPQFSADQKQASTFVTTILFFSLVAFIFFSAILFGFKDIILSFFGDQAILLSPYLHVVLWLTASLMFMAVMEAYSRSLLRVAFPYFIREVFTRLSQSILIFLFFIQLITFHQVITGHILVYVLAATLLLLSLTMSGNYFPRLDRSILSSGHLPEIFRFSSLSFISMGSMALIGKVDSLMVAGMTGFAANAIYTTSYYIATVIEIPKRALSQTVMPLIAQAFRHNNPQEIASLYSKVAINQFIIGALLLIGIMANLHNIYVLMPKGEIFQAGTYVVLLVGLGKLIDMLFGPSSEIIVLSRYYAFNIVVLLALAVVVILFNLILIPRYGITGAAIGTCAAMFFFNAVKYIFIWKKFGLQPFTRQTLKVFVVALVVYLGTGLMPKLEKTILDMFIRSALITMVYGGMVILTGCSPDINRIVEKGIRFLKGT